MAMSQAEKEARQMMADKKAAEGAEKAYNKASSVEPSADPRDAVRGQRGYAKGGSVSASSRADGIAQRGKTRGKMC
jgi:hypothetical protein